MTKEAVVLTIVSVFSIIPAVADPPAAAEVLTIPFNALQATDGWSTPVPPADQPGGRDGGDTCEAAIPILDLPFHDTGSTCGYTNDYDEACPYEGSTAPDVAYSITPQSDVSVDITLCNGTTYDSKLYIYQDACPGTLIACNDDACPGYVSQVLAVPLTAGTTYFIIVDGYGGSCGNYVLDVAAVMPPPVCNADALYGQPPHMPGDSWSAGTSAVTSQFSYVVYENYSGVSVPICDVSWWGLSLYPSFGSWFPCDPTGMTFEIKFYEAGYMPGAEVASYQVAPTIVDTGLRYNTFPLYYFRVPNLEPCVTLSDGWVSIQSQLNPSDCAFLWMSARSGLDGHSWQNQYGYLWDYWYDEAFCLAGLYVPTYGACCDDNTSTCTENVEMLDCAGPGMRFAANMACGDLDPPCGLLPGACCHPDATCDLTVQADCSDNWLGPGTTCLQCPCIVLPPPDATLEAEECGQDANGGCNMAEPAFEPLAFGQTVYGTVWNNGSNRDTDWYEITVTQPTILHVTLKAEFQASFGFAEQTVYGEPGCNNVVGYLNPVAAPDECEEVTVSSLCVPPGTYYAVVVPQWSDLVTCPSEYWLTLTGDECVIPTGACCHPDGSCTQMTQFDCTGFFNGNGTPCETAICTGACCNMDGSCQETSQLDCAGGFAGIGSLCANTYCPVLNYGDMCPFPIVLNNPALPLVDVNSTCGRGHDYVDTCLGDYDSGEDIIYQLTLPTDTCVKISVEGEQDWHDHIGVAVDTVCPPGEPCLAYATTTSRHCFLNNVSLTGGVTYYIMIDTSGSPYCINYTMTIEDCPPPEPGVTCENPIVLTDPPLPLVDQNMTCGFGNDYSSGTSCLDWYDWGEDVIYKLQFSTNKCISITVDGVTWLDNWIGIALDTACPPGNPCLAYATSDSGTHAAIQNIHLDANVPYYLMVDTGIGKSCIDYILQIDECPPLGDGCDSPVPVSDVTNLPFDTTRATVDGPGVCQNSQNLWFCYTATATGETYFSLCGSSYDTMLAVYDGCYCWAPLLGCNDDACGLQSEVVIPTVAGQQYLVEVGGYGSESGPGLLTIGAPACPGDLNCDGWIDFADINPFVQYLSDFAGWQAAYPACNPRNGDINGDGAFGQGSFADINPFVTLMTSSPIQCP